MLRTTSTGSRGGRPMILSTRGVVASGHYLATQIGADILRQGGNAIDAAVATGFALSVLLPQENGIAGEVPTLVYSSGDRRAYAVSGHGVAPAKATIDHFRNDLKLEAIPGDGFLPAVVPPAVATYLLLLERWGTRRLADVLTPAIELAGSGFPMHDSLHNAIAGVADRFRSEWPSSVEVFLPGGKPPPMGAVWRNPDWASTFRKLVEAESRFKNREEGLKAAYDVFYRGPVAERIVDFSASFAVRDDSGDGHIGLLTLDDFDSYETRIEDPVHTTYRGLDVHKCGPWTQGPVLLQTLNLLEGFDLSAMGHNSSQAIHTIVECMKLAYADREFYYGDPLFTDVPLDELLSKEYAAERRKLLDPEAASLQLRPGNHPPIEAEDMPRERRARKRGDTTKLEVIDAAGNVVSATASGGWLLHSPVIAGLGFPLGTRGQMFSLDPEHPNCLQPGKRPRTTLTPSLALRGGRAVLSFGSPGGDAQDQWALQFLLNVVDYGMNLQEAVEAATFWSLHFPDSFYPHPCEPGRLCMEQRIGEPVRKELISKGHLVRTMGPWSGGNTLAGAIDHETGVMSAAASPRIATATAAGL